MNTLIALLPFVLVGPWLLFLPGYLTQLWFASRQPSSLSRDWLETAFVSLLFSLCLTGWAGLVLVEFGWFSLTRLLALVGACCLVLGLLVVRRGAGKPALKPVLSSSKDNADKEPALKPVLSLSKDNAERVVRTCSLRVSGDRWTWLLLGIVLVAAVLYFHPHEYILGGSDAGVYVNLGGHIVRSGSLLFHDPELAAMDPAHYPALFRQQPSYLITRYIQFPGFYVSDTQPGQVIPQFYPLHPVWLAIAHSLGGVRASLYVTPLWGALACLAVGLTARTLFGRRAGALAAALLAISATQIWFARYPTSEALTQLLLFGGIYAFSRFMADESPEMGVLAGLSLGQVMLVRADSYFLLAIPVLLAVYLRLRRRLGRQHLAFFVPFLLLSLHSLAHGFLQSWPYLYNNYRFQLALLPLPALVAAGAVSVIGFVVLDVWARGRAERLSELARWVSRGTTALALLVVLAAGYAYFIWPWQADLAAAMPYWYGDNAIPYVEPYNLVRLGWYLSPLGIALGVLGMWWMLRRDLSQQTALFLGVGLFFSFLFIQNSRNNPHHIYVMRRYMPAVIPTFTIAAAYALARWWRRQDRWRWLALGGVMIQVALLSYAARTVVRQVDYRGLLAQLEPWAEALDPDAVILFDDDQPVSTGATVGTPLRYLFDYTVFDLQETYLTAETWEELVHTWQAQGRPVLIAVGPQGVREPFAQWSLASLPVLWLDTTVLESSYYKFPQQVLRTTLSLELYELLPAASDAVYPLRIDVGSDDFFYLGEGWHGKERLPGDTTMRWTSDAAEINLPAGAIEDDDAQLRFQMAASAHAGQAPTEVRLRYGTQIVALWQVGTDFAAYEATLPASALQDGPLSLWLETDAWSPAALGLGADARDLGVMVDWISVE